MSFWDGERWWHWDGRNWWLFEAEAWRWHSAPTTLRPGQAPVTYQERIGPRGCVPVLRYWRPA